MAFFSPLQMTIFVQDQELEALKKVFNMAQLNMHPWTCTHTSSHCFIHIFLQLIFFPLQTIFALLSKGKYKYRDVFSCTKCICSPVLGLCAPDSIGVVAGVGYQQAHLFSGSIPSKSGVLDGVVPMLGGFWGLQLLSPQFTTDLRHRCTDGHTGTSVSAPMVAGIIALALEAK